MKPFIVSCISDEYGLITYETIRSKLSEKGVDANNVDSVTEFLSKIGVDRALVRELAESIVRYDGYVCFSGEVEEQHEMLKIVEKLFG